MNYGELHTLAKNITNVAQSSHESSFQAHHSLCHSNKKYDPNILYFPTSLSPLLHSKHSLSTLKDYLEGLIHGLLNEKVKV